ncbi:MAG: IPT/TIG domain-containing protein [Acidobacteriota bacterium]|nr:IPT/TIG domain-containing protein [Acidobacteriota bacterium]
MALVDEHGRILGRFNLLDVAMAVLLLGLIPLGYGGYALFRVPLPRLTAVAPASVQFDKEMRVTIRGENLRPYMRVSLGTFQTRTFLFKDSTTAEVVFDGIPTGKYDVVLYDFAQERHRLAAALTIAPPPLPTTSVHIAGFLTGVPAGQVARFTAGYVFPQNGEILAAGDPVPDAARVVTGDHSIEIPVPATVRIPVLLRMLCNIQTAGSGGGVAECRTNTAIFPSAYLNLATDEGTLPLLVIDVQPPLRPTMVEIHARVAGPEEAAMLMQAGDKDLGASQNEFAAGAVVISPPNASRDFRLRIPAFPTLTGWQYAGQMLRVGGPLQVTTPRYQFSSTVLWAPPLPAPTATP